MGCIFTHEPGDRRAGLRAVHTRNALILPLRLLNNGPCHLIRPCADRPWQHASLNRCSAWQCHLLQPRHVKPWFLGHDALFGLAYTRYGNGTALYPSNRKRALRRQWQAPICKTHLALRRHGETSMAASLVVLQCQLTAEPG